MTSPISVGSAANTCKCSPPAVKDLEFRELIEVEDRRSRLRAAAYIEKACLDCGQVELPTHLAGYMIDRADIRRIVDNRRAILTTGKPLTRLAPPMPAWSDLPAFLEVPMTKPKLLRHSMKLNSPEASTYIGRALGISDGENRADLPDHVRGGVYADRQTVKHIAENDHAHLEIILFARQIVFSPVEVWRVPRQQQQPQKLLYLSLLLAGEQLRTSLVAVDDETGRMITAYRLEADPSRANHVENSRRLPNDLVWCAWAGSVE